MKVFVFLLIVGVGATILLNSGPNNPTSPVRIHRTVAKPSPRVVRDTSPSDQAPEKTLSLPAPTEATSAAADVPGESKIEVHPDTPPSLTPDPIVGPAVPDGYEFAHVPGEQVHARNSLHGSVVGRLIDGAIVCEAADAINLVFDDYASYYSQTHMTQTQRDEQQWIHGGGVSKPDPGAFGCVIVPEGVPLVVTQRLGGYNVVVIRFNGVEAKGITRFDMAR